MRCGRTTLFCLRKNLTYMVSDQLESRATSPIAPCQGQSYLLALALRPLLPRHLHQTLGRGARRRPLSLWIGLRLCAWMTCSCTPVRSKMCLRKRACSKQLVLKRATSCLCSWFCACVFGDGDDLSTARCGLYLPPRIDPRIWGRRMPAQHRQVQDVTGLQLWSTGWRPLQLNMVGPS